MSVLRTALAELIGLFVDDGSLVVAILGWIGLYALAIHPLLGGGAMVFAAGCLLILVENAVRSARRR